MWKAVRLYALPTGRKNISSYELPNPVRKSAKNEIPISIGIQNLSRSLFLFPLTLSCPAEAGFRFSALLSFFAFSSFFRFSHFRLSFVFRTPCEFPPASTHFP